MSERAGISAVALSKQYPTSAGPVRALDDISLEVEPGGSLAITGPSGCGKSTLLGLIGGLEIPSAGSVLTGGHALADLSERARARFRRREIGFVFQADNLLPFLTATENVAQQLALQGPRDGAERCAELLARLGLAAHADKLPDQLSGGQRQRVAVARALIHRPRTILADEPTGALDGASSAAVMDLLQAAQRELGATLIVVTHDRALAGRLDRRLALRDGRVQADGDGAHA